MNINELNNFTFYKDTITVNGETEENTGVSLPTDITAVQYHRGNDYCLEEPSMKKVALTKYQFAVDKYFELVEAEKKKQELLDNPPYVEPTLEDKILSLKKETQNYIDTQAQTLGFDNINSISKFLSLPTSNFYLDAVKLNEWQNSVWEYIEPELQKVLEGLRELPTDTEELPKYGNS